MGISTCRHKFAYFCNYNDSGEYLLFINIDAVRNQLVWEGAATGRVTDSTRQNIEQVSHDAIVDIFAQFP
jgi:hypothetical protein